jgi:SAM-dependent methyltransferase
MNLDVIIYRETPAPWSEGDNIPWNDPEFSQRMLNEHLSQDHDLASRRAEVIEQHVGFIHRELLQEQPSRILDMGCGPGLYASRLARLGHSVHGVDFSPASIAYAWQTAAKEGLKCAYTEGDLREVDFGEGYDLAMLIYGELNVFSPENARLILRKARAALKPGGRLLLEPSTEDSIRGQGHESPYWYSSVGGLFAGEPHIVLTEAYWDELAKAATNRFYVIGAHGTVTRYAASYQAYSDAEYEALLRELVLDEITFWPNLTGQGERSQSFIAITATNMEMTASE